MTVDPFAAFTWTRASEIFIEKAEKDIAAWKEKQQSQNKEQSKEPAKDTQSNRYQELIKTVVDDSPGKKPDDVMRDYKNEAAKAMVAKIDGKSWPGPEADVKIAQALLTQGYDRPAVHRAINNLSPETAGKAQMDMAKYSQGITEKALTPEIKQQIQDRTKGNSLER